MSSKNETILYLILMLIIVILSLIIKIGTLSTNNHYLYLKKDTKIETVDVTYPYFKNNDINIQINNYLKGIKKGYADKIDYQINYVDKYVSILFNKYNKNKITSYDSFIFDQEGNSISLDKLITNQGKLKEIVKTYILNKKLNVTPDKLVFNNYKYFLKDNSLELILTEDNKIDKFDINYNELKEVINLKFKEDADYVPMTTTKVKYDKVISFTFDDGPSKYTSEIMDVLDEYGYKATFFQVGYMIRPQSDIVKEVVERGFEVGNHTTDHSNLNKLKPDKAKSKITDNNDLFYSITGKTMELIRPPYGLANDKIKAIIDKPIIKWSVDTRDWESRNTEKIVELTKAQTKDGDIILFHDLYKTTLEAVKILVPYFHEQGYNIVTVSELYKQKGITLEPQKVYYKAKVSS